MGKRTLRRRTKIGLAIDLFMAQVSNSKRHGREPPNYTKDWFIGWLYDQTIYHSLYDRWVESEYIKNLRPSVDRVNSDLPYSIENIQILTFGDNNSKQTKSQVQVLQQWTYDGLILLAEFSSREDARICTGVIGTNISKCLKGIRPRAGGYVWKTRDKNLKEEY